MSNRKTHSPNHCRDPPRTIVETHDPRKTIVAQPHPTSHPGHTQDPQTRDAERKGNGEVERT